MVSELVGGRHLCSRADVVISQSTSGPSGPSICIVTMMGGHISWQHMPVAEANGRHAGLDFASRSNELAGLGESAGLGGCESAEVTHVSQGRSSGMELASQGCWSMVVLNINSPEPSSLLHRSICPALKSVGAMVAGRRKE